MGAKILQFKLAKITGLAPSPRAVPLYQCTTCKKALFNVNTDGEILCVTCGGKVISNLKVVALR